MPTVSSAGVSNYSNTTDGTAVGVVASNTVGGNSVSVTYGEVPVITLFLAAQNENDIITEDSNNLILE